MVMIGIETRETWRQASKVQPPDARLCVRCKGMRLLQYDVPPGHPLFKAIIPCPLCGKLQKEADHAACD